MKSHIFYLFIGQEPKVTSLQHNLDKVKVQEKPNKTGKLGFFLVRKLMPKLKRACHLWSSGKTKFHLVGIHS